MWLYKNINVLTFNIVKYILTIFCTLYIYLKKYILSTLNLFNINYAIILTFNEHCFTISLFIHYFLFLDVFYSKDFFVQLAKI